MRVLAWVLGLCVMGCSTGEGEGWVRSEKLFVKDCWDGPFDLQPTFFAANPHENNLSIRVQRGDNLEEVSDGLGVLVNDVAGVRESSLGQALRVGLPVGVVPPGGSPQSAEPPDVSLSLYLHATCHAQNGALYALSGSITFSSLFSGDPNESSADDRLTEAAFEAVFTDPRDPEVAHQSTVRGEFSFYFQRGQPAQPFP